MKLIKDASFLGEAQLLPSLQEKYPKVFNQRVDVRTLSVSVPLEPQGFCQKTFDSHDVPTLGELLLGFFEYFAKKFDYENDAISVRLGKKTKRSYVAKHVYPCNERMSQWNYICIEEPFNYSNTAHSVHDQYVFEQIRLALAEDYEKLEQTRDLHAFLDVNPLSSKPESFQRYNVAESVLNSYSESTTNNDSKNLCCQGDCVNNSDHDHKICGSNDSDGCSSDLSCEWQHSSNCELLPKADL
uniref:PAP-associated domain-containing protein n=1 Tax=Syphacia muris TaxID=451379 RepID=A0A0N5AR65_9BILA